MRFPRLGFACLSIGVLCLLSLLTAPRAAAQSGAGGEDNRPIITEVGFEGNEHFSDELLTIQVRTRPNRRFLDIPGANWWLWLYRLGESRRLGRRLSRGLLASGEAPAYLDTSLVAADVERLQFFYRQEGFRQAQVAARIDTLQEGRRAHVTFLIESGQPTQIREIRYAGIDALPADQREQLIRASLLRPPRGAPGASLAFEPREQRYSEPTLEEERRRLLAFLRDRGYAAVSRDSINAIVIPTRLDSFDVVFRINPGPLYRFGDVHFRVAGPEQRPPSSDTLEVVAEGPADTVGVITVRIEDEDKLDADLLTRSLRFRPGEVYNQSRVLDTKRELEGTGVFSFTNITPAAVDTSRLTAPPRLSHLIDLRTRQRHQVRLETFALQRSDGLTERESQFGIGVGATYRNVNFLGGGETFQAGITGSVAEDFQSPQAEVTASLTYPYLTFPAGFLERKLDLYDSRTRYSLSLLTARREELRLIIRGRGAFRARLELDHNPRWSSLIDIPDFTLNNPDSLSGFTRIFLNRVIGINPEQGDTIPDITDPVQLAQITEDYTQPSVNSAVRYTLRALNANPLLRNRGYSLEAGVEVGGNTLYLLDRYVFTPGPVAYGEEELPGLPIFRGNRRENKLVYRQYVRALADYRRYIPLSRSRVFAWHVNGGIAQPIFVSQLVPFDRRFYTGGASGVRGWDLRALGPGPTNSFQGGEIKLQSGAEVRIRFIRDLFTAQWSYVLFADAGNVWLGPRNPGQPDAKFRLDRFYRQVGVGSGVGLRIAWEFFIARFDLAYKVYDPSYEDVTGGQRNVRGFFSDRSPILHFGIGHAF